jgi:hypothetical protein
MATNPLIQIPTNTSFVQSSKFIFQIPTLPFMRYFVQDVGLPGVSTSAPEVATPFVPTYRHGGTLRYEVLTLSLLLDEDLRSWEETYDWLVSLTKPTQFPEYAKYKNQNGALYHDAILTINTNANISNMRFQFMDCHPINLSGIQFSHRENSEVQLTATVTFRYDYFKLNRLET